MKDFPYFRWYPKDAESDCQYAALSLPELGLFHRCLNHSWVNGGVPSDMQEFSRELRIPMVEVRRYWPRVSRCFIEHDDGRCRNPRQEMERDHVLEKSGKARISVSKRKDRFTNVPTNDTTNVGTFVPTNDILRAYGSVSVFGSVVENLKEEKKGPDEIERWYREEFYPAFPLKKAGQAGLKAARAHLRTAELRSLAMERLLAQLPELEAREKSKRPYPATWINGRRWEDETIDLDVVAPLRNGRHHKSVNDQIDDMFARGEL
jgi:hypothetical protein